MSRHVIMPRDVPHVTSWHVTSWHVTSCHITSCHVMSSCHVMYLMSRHVTSCHVMSHLAPSCHVMSYHVTSYHVESRGTVTRPTLYCQLTSSTRNQFKLSMTVFVGCPEGCRYNTASAVYDLVNIILKKIKKINTLICDWLLEGMQTARHGVLMATSHGNHLFCTIRSSLARRAGYTLCTYTAGPDLRTWFFRETEV